MTAVRWPVVGERVEVYGEHRGWVLTSAVIEAQPDVFFRVPHPDTDTASLTVRPDGKVKWRWRDKDKVCATCGASKHANDRQCDLCWEVEHRLKDYLRRGGVAARAFVRAALAEEDARCGRG